MPSEPVRTHYEQYPYPDYPLLATVRREDTYALNLQALWARFNSSYLPPAEGKILSAGCGAFAPYPMALANPQAQVTALDLSRANLRRAHLHCLVHRKRTVAFLQGDLLDPAAAPGPFHYIDCFGVLHHLGDPAAGLRALQQRLLPGGILRVMVYGRYARREAESIRRAVKLLGIQNSNDLQRLLRRAQPGSRLREYLDNSWEARSTSGLADLFLHPCVHTYRIDDFLDLVSQSSLTPLLFTHDNARTDPEEEINRLRRLDLNRETPTNIICYLGHDTRGPCPVADAALLHLNPCLQGAVSRLRMGPVQIPPRLGQENPPLHRVARQFLRRFRAPLPVAALSHEERATAQTYHAAQFLISYRGDAARRQT
jgi:2-polyprenyl-3-methyl-5-hydroxy-6-metoxy-1,4-benzoquinol methylase